MFNSWPKALNCFDCKFLRRLKWSYVLRTIFDLESLALTEWTLEMMSTIRRINSKGTPERIYKTSNRVKSDRAHSQQGTTASGKYGQSRVRCATAHSRCWSFTTLFIYWAVNKVYYGSLWMIILMKASPNCTFGVRHLSAQSNQGISNLLIQLALKWCVLQLTSNWWTLFGEGGWAARYWCVVKLTQIKKSLLAWI